MVEYSKVNVKLSDRQLKQLKTAAKNKKRNNSENEFKNVWWKLSASWIVTDDKIKLRNIDKAKKYI